jgi:D-alanyl-D-alanine carboxypeptidase
MVVNWGRLRGAACSRVAACLVLAGAAISGLAAPRTAHAQIGSPQYSAIVVDAASGTVLSADNPDELHHPASLTKMMTLYMLFEAVRDHRASFDQYVPVSPHAASMEPTKLGVPAGGALTVEQAVLGIVTQSANDAASAVGEMLGGDEDRFAEMMTLRAHALGMTHTTFRNASGLPDPDQWTTARDIAILSRHLVQDFPNEYRYFSVPSFNFHGRTILNHDTMLRIYPGADGLKTGWIRTSGHNLATSAMRGNVRLIGVVLGAASNGERDQDMMAQLDAGFSSQGVPVLVAHRAPAPRFGTLVASAHAAPMPPPEAMFRVAAAQPMRTPRVVAAPRVQVAAAMVARPVPPRSAHGRAAMTAPARAPAPRSAAVVAPARASLAVQPIGLVQHCAAGQLKSRSGCLSVRHVAAIQ